MNEVTFCETAVKMRSPVNALREHIMWISLAEFLAAIINFIQMEKIFFCSKIDLLNNLPVQRRSAIKFIPLCRLPALNAPFYIKEI